MKKKFNRIVCSSFPAQSRYQQELFRLYTKYANLICEIPKNVPLPKPVREPVALSSMMEENSLAHLARMLDKYSESENRTELIQILDTTEEFIDDKENLVVEIGSLLPTVIERLWKFVRAKDMEL